MEHLYAAVALCSVHVVSQYVTGLSIVTAALKVCNESGKLSTTLSQNAQVCLWPAQAADAADPSTAEQVWADMRLKRVRPSLDLMHSFLL